MSTISKINPGTRQARAARRNAIRSLERAIPYIDTMRRPGAILLHHVLNEVRTRSSRTGAEKSETFGKLMRDLMPATVADMEAAA